MLIKISIICMLLSIVNAQSSDNSSDFDYYDLPVNPDSDSNYVYAYNIINYLLCTNTSLSGNCKLTNYVINIYLYFFLNLSFNF